VNVAKENLAMINFENIVADMLNRENDSSSHTELDYNTFHPSQLAMCKRQLFISKLGLSHNSVTTLGRFRMGTMVHKFLEENFEYYCDYEVKTEKSISMEVRDKSGIDITVTGTCDVYIPELQCIADYKTQSGWYYFDPHEDNVYEQKERHLTQLSIYMKALEVDNGKLVYIDKGSFEVKQFPKTRENFISLQKHLLNEAINRGTSIKKYLINNGFPKSAREIPFEKCGCWLCDSEQTNKLEFNHMP